MPDASVQIGAPLLLDSPTTPSTTQRQLSKQVRELQGKLNIARDDLSKLIDRHKKMSACVEAEVAQLRALLQTRENTSNDIPSALLNSAAAAVATPTLAAPLPLSQLSTDNGAAAAESSTAAIAADDEFRARPIGYLRTPYVEKNGTPRQGCVCPSSIGLLKLQLGGGLNGFHSLEGLTNFSHAWIVFVFHLNGNQAAKSKVTPPRVETKVGLFATRTPHRPNPIGLSLARILEVKGDTITFGGIDLVDGTPILDVKPYVPFADGHQLEPPPRVAPWLVEKPTPDLTVVFTAQADAQLQALAPSLRLLRSVEQAKAMLTEVLAADPRSVHWRKSRADLEYGFSIDSLNAVVAFEGGKAIVTQIQHIDLCDRSHVGGVARSAVVCE